MSKQYISHLYKSIYIQYQKPTLISVQADSTRKVIWAQITTILASRKIWVDDGSVGR